jgi:hypothetical protein
MVWLAVLQLLRRSVALLLPVAHPMCMSYYSSFSVIWRVLNRQRMYEYSLSSEATASVPSSSWYRRLRAAASCVYFVCCCFFPSYVCLFGCAFRDSTGASVLETNMQSPAFDSSPSR